ncbi:hypothetical protein [Segatella copri]|uniref:hypothetical protein n=1 Tax=Segatella copri TaxID=165179 RepID=UPI001F227A47|nr:hypothetical protein [Segatella copri]
MIKRNEAKILVPIISAYAEGRILQYKEKEEWRDIEESEGLSINTIIQEAENYRIKPEYRPFANAEECWQEMQKHQPFGWIKCKEGYFSIVYVNDEYAGLGDRYDSSILLASKNSYTDNTFADGTPFGIKEEE